MKLIIGSTIGVILIGILVFFLKASAIRIIFPMVVLLVIAYLVYAFCLGIKEDISEEKKDE